MSSIRELAVLAGRKLSKPAPAAIADWALLLSIVAILSVSVASPIGTRVTAVFETLAAAL